MPQPTFQNRQPFGIPDGSCRHVDRKPYARFRRQGVEAHFQCKAVDPAPEFARFDGVYEIRRWNDPTARVHDPDQPFVECGALGHPGLNDRLKGQHRASVAQRVADQQDGIARRIVCGFAERRTFVAWGLELHLLLRRFPLVIPDRI